MSLVHQFQRYAQAENVVTNNTLGLLRQVYRESPKRFEKLVYTIWENSDTPDFGLNFRQQVRGGGGSVPDGMLSQDSVRFVIETKLGNEFDPKQVLRHCAELEKSTYRYALLLFGGSADGMAAKVLSLRDELRRRNIAFAAISFSQLIEQVGRLYEGHHEEMRELVDDYSAFCVAYDLLPQDAWSVFVPPCGESFAENIAERLYYCSAERSIRPSRYLGVYSDKAVRAIGTISTVAVDPRIDLDAGTVSVTDGGKALTADEQARILRACRAAAAHGWPIDSGHKFFLCDAMVATECRKRTPGGIQNRRYLNLRELLKSDAIPDLPTLAAALRGVDWA